MAGNRRVKITPAEINQRRWWETWWGQSIVLISTGVIAGLLIWAVTRHYDKPTPSTAIEEPKTTTQLQPPQQAQTSTPATTSSSQVVPTKKQKSPSQTSQHATARTGGDNSPALGSITQGAGSALSINQQGGITAGTINVGPPPLLINKEQQAHLTASVQPFVSQWADKKINISLHNATNETAEFGSGLDTAFKTAGFQTNTGVVTFIGTALSHGVTIRYGVNQTKLAEAVRDWLLRDRVVDKVYRAPGTDKDDFLIIVAP